MIKRYGTVCILGAYVIGNLATIVGESYGIGVEMLFGALCLFILQICADLWIADKLKREI